MIMEYLVTINIISSNNTLLNPTNTPILYYWNGEDKQLENTLSKDSNFIEFFNSKCDNIEEYGKSKLSYFIYNINTEEIESNKELYIQKIFPLSDIKNYKIADLYIFDIFNKLFQVSLHKSYIASKLDKRELIREMYDELQNKYIDKISDKTLRQYIGSQLNQVYNLSEENTKFVLKELNNIFLNK